MKVISVVTDGAPNMAKMRKDLFTGFQDKNSCIFVYACQAHVLNLFSKELDKEFRDTTSKVFFV